MGNFIKFILFASIFVTFSTIELIDSFRVLYGRPIDKHGFLGVPPTSKKQLIDPYTKELWFEQKLDHFDPTNQSKWKQRYFVNDKYFKKHSNNTNDSPIFLQLGGEGEANPIWLQEGQVATNYGPYFNALLILLEHRYYGKSRPTKDMSTENLKYLTSEQALQDTANFIEFINRKYNLNSNNKWIVFGGSYSGSLAAWFRMKYPHLVAGAISSSAPVMAVIDFYDYLKVVDESLGPECVQQIRSATDELSKLMKSKQNWLEIEKTFKLCTPFDGSNPMDVANFFANLAGNFEGVVQYNKDNRAFEGVPGTNITIDTICSIMNDNGAGLSSTNKLAKVNELLLRTTLQECLEFKYEDFIRKISVIDFDKTEVSGERQWTYQTCSEFGFFQTSDCSSNSTGQPFGQYFPLEFFIQQCIDIYGPEFNRKFIENAIDFTNNFYGGFNLTVTKVMFINGRIDPWHSLGVLKDLNPSSKAYLLSETAHCADMYPDSTIDPPSLKQIRNVIKKTIGNYLE